MPRERAAASPKVREHEVLAAATEVFYTRGYPSSSVQIIADELGILKGSLYYYMNSKEDLLFAILDGVHGELGKILENARALEADTARERLHWYVREQVLYAAHNVKSIAIYYRDGDQLSEQHRERIFAQRREHAAFVRDLVAQGQSAGEFTGSDDALVLTNLIFGSFVWTYRWFDPAGTIKPDELATSAADFAVRSVRA